MSFDRIRLHRRVAGVRMPLLSSPRDIRRNLSGTELLGILQNSFAVPILLGPLELVVGTVVETVNLILSRIAANSIDETTPECRILIVLNIQTPTVKLSPSVVSASESREKVTHWGKRSDLPNLNSSCSPRRGSLLLQGPWHLLSLRLRFRCGSLAGALLWPLEPSRGPGAPSQSQPRRWGAGRHASLFQAPEVLGEPNRIRGRLL